MSRKTRSEAVEPVPREGRFTLVPGDIVRLKHPNAYCKPGKYAVLSLDMTVCLARTKKKRKRRRITSHLVYIQITELCFFKRTRKRIEPLSSLTSTPSGNRALPASWEKLESR